MISSRPLRIGLAAALVAVVGGCSSDSTGPSAPAASLDQVFTEASLSSLSSFSPFSPVSRGTAPISLSTAMPAPSSCSFSAGTFVCPGVTIGGLQFSRSFTLYDDNGLVQSQFVSGVTSKVKLESNAHGIVTTGTAGVAVDQSQSLLVSGLTSSTHFLDGTSITTITDVVPAGSTTAPMTTTVVVAFNSLELPRGSNSYPGSGSIDLTATSSASPSAHARLTFNGTSKVAVTLDLSSLPTQHCTLDLSQTNLGCI